MSGHLLTHSKAVVGESRSSLILLVQLLLAADGVLHEVHRLPEENTELGHKGQWSRKNAPMLRGTAKATRGV